MQNLKFTFQNFEESSKYQVHRIKTFKYTHIQKYIHLQKHTHIHLDQKFQNAY